MNLYVYFKFIPKDVNSVAGNIREIQNQLIDLFPGLECSLLKRPEKDSEGRETWMEVYALEGGNEKVFQDKLSELAIANDLPQPRFCELFIPVIK